MIFPRQLLVIACLAAVASVFAHGGCQSRPEEQTRVDTVPVLRPELEALVASMAGGGSVESEIVGMLGIAPPQWRRYLGLAGLATDEELLALVEHADPVVRCYAFRALAARSHPQTFRILVQHLSDTQRVRSFIGCSMFKQRVADYLLSVVRAEDEEFAGGLALTAEQAAIVDSILLFRPHLDLQSRTSMLHGFVPRPHWYPRVRMLAVGESVVEALPALARYRRPDDVRLIVEAIESSNRFRRLAGLSAAAEFPDGQVWPTLLRRFQALRPDVPEDMEEYRRACSALAKYERAEVSALFWTALNRESPPSPGVTEALDHALQDTPHTLFADIARKLAEIRASNATSDD